MTDKLQFRRVTGEPAEAEARIDDEDFPAGEYLLARRVWLDGGTEIRQHRVAPGPRRGLGYERLDNEIIAGRLLHEASGWGGYPPEVSCLYGDEASSAEPYALFEPYRGERLSQVGTHMLAEEREAFEVGLLTGLCWVAAAGIAHRALSPDTVLWDSLRRQVQITDFSRSTVFGVPREAITGLPGWVAREARPGSAGSVVGERDDVLVGGPTDLLRPQPGRGTREPCATGGDRAERAAQRGVRPAGWPPDRQGPARRPDAAARPGARESRPPPGAEGRAQALLGGASPQAPGGGLPARGRRRYRPAAGPRTGGPAAGAGAGRSRA